MAPVEELVLLDLDRSNKGASKQRRDQINAEINVLRDLLPLPESSRQRLSQLQVMSLSCVYIRKCNVLKKLFRSQSHEATLPDSLDFFQAMTGFLLVTTREGKLIYISENVTDYLGHSMVDMKTQGDSLYDIVDKRDHGTVQAKLLQGGGALDSKDILSEDVSFFCRMNMSRTLKRQSGFGDVKVMHIQGHFVPVTNNTTDSNSSSSRGGLNDQQQYVFMASCSPLITPDLKENLVLNNTKVFKTVHQMDMAFMEITKMAEHHLGYTSDELFKTSWYSMIHPEDIQEAKEKHMQLVRSNHHEIGCMMTVRMLKADGSFFWVNIVMHVKQTLMSQNDEPFIVCINQIISAQEAYQIRMQGQMFSMYPGRVQELWGSHMPSVSSTQNMNVNVNQWIQQDGNNSVPVPGFPCSMPNYPSSQSRYPIMYPSAPTSACTASLAANMDRVRNSGRGGIVGGPATAQYELPTLVQTDKLKAMLKRKIQGPTTVQSQQCRPVKVPKMSWNEMDGSAGSERKVYQELEPAPLHTHVLTEQFRNGEVRNVVEHSSGQVVQVMMATGGQPAVPVYLTKKSYPSLPEMVRVGGGRSSSRSDYTTTNISSHRVKMEQVVPDISVPDSFLTPDPSPISSPEPSSVVKTEVMDPDELGSSSSSSTTSSVCILQALEKLASQPQQGGLLSVKTELPSPTNTATTKQNCSGRVGGKATESRELPIFDAFDIENFFDMLSPAANESKASIKVENLHEPRRAKASQGIQGTMQMPHLKAERSGLEVPSQSPPLDSRNSMAFLPSSMEVPMLQIKTEIKETEVPCFHSTSTAASRKDIVVSSTMIQSPKSVGSQDTMARCESLDDLLSCFSDEGLDLSPFQADPMNNSSNNNNNNISSRSEVDVAMCKFGSAKDPLGLQKMSSFDSICQVPVYPSSDLDLERGLEELSPQSTSSSMSREDDLMDRSSSVWSFGMELVDNLDSTASPSQIVDSPKHSADIKAQEEEEMGMDDVFDQVHLLLDSLVPSQGSL